MSNRKSKTTVLLALHILLAVYSLSGVLSKLASGFSFSDIGFYLCYCGIIALLGVYAIGWQQIIKRLPLTTAYANKAVTVVWGIIWGILLFSEEINLFKALGAVVVLAGVALYAVADNATEEKG
ncbi:transporter [Enorma massiliensis]|uniref:Transporter n=1 Tax=Enorma massiliensis TaxID=1472761 RepID=A0A1Y3UGW2_9ACTN|nr:transporter [Enorma massiliensis]OUN44620.1 transporter [Enorma massiliensis]